jgi:hypothetical protein
MPYSLLLMPMKAYIAPDISNIAPAIPIAGVTFGWIGRDFAGSAPVRSRVRESEGKDTEASPSVLVG